MLWGRVALSMAPNSHCLAAGSGFAPFLRESRAEGFFPVSLGLNSPNYLHEATEVGGGRGAGGAPCPRRPWRRPRRCSRHGRSAASPCWQELSPSSRAPAWGRGFPGAVLPVSAVGAGLLQPESPEAQGPRPCAAAAVTALGVPPASATGAFDLARDPPCYFCFVLPSPGPSPAICPLTNCELSG